MGKIRIIVADDHEMLRQGIRMAVAEDQNINIVAEAQDGHDAISKVKKHTPDILLLDIAMPNLNGLTALPMIKEAVPETRIIVFSMYEKEAYVHQTLSWGATGYILKTSSGCELVRAIKQVHEGKFYLSASIKAEVIKGYLYKNNSNNTITRQSKYDTLTEREQQVFRMITEGHTTKKISALLYLSPKTVEKHRSNICKKLDLHDPLSMMRYALKIGVIDPDLWVG